MKKVLFVASIGMLLAIGARNAAADTITSGDLLFTCISCGPNGTAPTGGSFSYDDTTNLFSKLTFAWDGFNVRLGAPDQATGSNLQSDQESVFLKLIGVDSAPLIWTGVCTQGNAEGILGLPCAGEFAILLDNLILGSATLPITTAMPVDSAGATVTGTDLVTTFNTPEPGTLALLLLGLPFLKVPRRRSPRKVEPR